MEGIIHAWNCRGNLRLGSRMEMVERENFPGWNFLGWEFSMVGIIQVESCPGWNRQLHQLQVF